MKVAILHGHVPSHAGPDEQDVLLQVETVSQALRELGHTPMAVPLTLDLQAAARVLQQLRPWLVFNLVESVQGRGHYIHLGTTLLEALQLPYTGASTAAMVATSNKLLAKKMLATAGLPTPSWQSMEAVLQDQIAFPGPYMIKSVWEHGSIGLDDDAVTTDPTLVRSNLARRSLEAAAPWFVERYVPGREFNLSLLAHADGPELLPAAEIEFIGYPADKVKIVGYRAKWEEDSFEYRSTCRRFEFAPPDAPLLARLAELARDCWKLFELRGYARVDFRVDAAGLPWILEVNANPCLAPDSGFVAAAQRAGLTLTQVIERILGDAHPASPYQETLAVPLVNAI